VDRQVKVRGFRVEPGEVEAALKAHRGLREAVVVAREDAPGDKRLVAYFVHASAPPPTVGQLRDFLKQSLPEYMLPSFFISLDGLPLTPNGKVDLDALPAPDGDRPELGQGYVAPRNALEEVLAGMWALVLDIERVGIHDSFFDLGGHSLLATQLITRIGETFQTELPLGAIFEAPDVASFAERMRREESQPGGFDKIAELLKRLEHLSDSEAAELLSAEGVRGN
jgi:acyl carrier protein